MTLGPAKTSMLEEFASRPQRHVTGVTEGDAKIYFNLVAKVVV